MSGYILDCDSFIISSKFLFYFSIQCYLEVKDPRGGGQARTESLIRLDFEQMLGNLKLERSSEQRVLSVSSRLNMQKKKLDFFL